MRLFLRSRVAAVLPLRPAGVQETMLPDSLRSAIPFESWEDVDRHRCDLRDGILAAACLSVKLVVTGPHDVFSTALR